MHGQAIHAEHIAGGVVRKLRVLTVEGLAGLWRCNFAAMAVALGQAGIHDGEDLTVHRRRQASRR